MFVAIPQVYICERNNGLVLLTLKRCSNVQKYRVTPKRYPSFNFVFNLQNTTILENHITFYMFYINVMNIHCVRSCFKTVLQHRFRSDSILTILIPLLPKNSSQWKILWGYEKSLPHQFKRHNQPIYKHYTERKEQKCIVDS